MAILQSVIVTHLPGPNGPSSVGVTQTDRYCTSHSATASLNAVLQALDPSRSAVPCQQRLFCKPAVRYLVKLDDSTD